MSPDDEGSAAAVEFIVLRRQVSRLITPLLLVLSCSLVLSMPAGCVASVLPVDGARSHIYIFFWPLLSH